MTKIEEIAVNHFSDGCFSEDIFNHEEAMKEISIEFVKWIQKEDYKINHLTNSFYKRFDIYKTFSVEEIFELFNNSENK